MKAEAHHSLEDLFGIAIKAEIEAQNIYKEISEYTKNMVLKEKMQFLAGEEEKHETILRGLFQQKFPGTEPVIPSQTVAPVPAWKPDEEGNVSDVLKAAMQTEEDAKTFYEAMAARIEEPKMQSMLRYLAAMEKTHYHLLETEYNAAMELEDYDRFDPAVHWGA
jgi:rubrerythrin